MFESKRSIYITAGVVLAALAVLVLILSVKKNNTADQADKQDQQTEVKVVQKDIDPKIVPPKIPQDIPLESDATVIQNHILEATDGKTQSVRVFKTEKPLAENYKLYTDYFKANGYTIQSFVDDLKSKMINAVKGDTRVQVTLNESTVDKSRTVDITVTDVVH